MARAKPKWASSTVIESDSLGEHLIERYRDDGDPFVHARSYSVELKESGFDEDGLARYLMDQFIYFVFSEEKVAKLREEDKRAHPRAQNIAKVKKDYVKDGTLGEFLLFLLTDGFLDIPMISHKIANKQSFKHEVYGADGLFFGEYNNQEKIGVGEAKVQKGFSAAVEDAIESLCRFHDATSSTSWEQELNVAPNNLSPNLSSDQISRLSNILTEENYADYPVVHPTFVCYETKQMENIEIENMSTEDKKERIEEYMRSAGFVDKVHEKTDETGSKQVLKADLVFFFLPVGDLDRFRKKMLVEIFPTLEHVIDDVIEKMKEGKEE